MKFSNPNTFAYELKDQLKTRDMLENLESKYQSDLEALEIIKNEMSAASDRRTELEIEIPQLNKDYQQYSVRYGLGAAHPDFEKNKQLRKESWIRIYESGEERDRIVLEFKSLKYKHDQLYNEVRELNRKIQSTRDFFAYYESHISLFSVATLEISGGKITFLLLTEENRKKIAISNLTTYASESPIGAACLNKMIGDSFTYKKPNGSVADGKVLDISLPSLQSMEEIIVSLEDTSARKNPHKISPFHLHDLYGSNNSRVRKGG